MANAFFPSSAKLYVGAAGAATSSCTEFQSYITNFSQTGGQQEIESIPLFGGAFIEKENPREQIEVSFDAIIQTTKPLLFDQLIMSSLVDGTTAVSSIGEGDAKVIYLQLADGSTYYTRAYNNARAITFDPEMSADEYIKGTITFKLSPATNDATPKANLKVATAAASTITWT